MELKCWQHTLWVPNSFCSNRTFMELKFQFLYFCWSVHGCSNRTFMELKYTVALPMRSARAGSNRTFMELK